MTCPAAAGNLGYSEARTGSEPALEGTMVLTWHFIEALGSPAFNTFVPSLFSRSSSFLAMSWPSKTASNPLELNSSSQNSCKSAAAALCLRPRGVSVTDCQILDQR